MKKQKTNFFKFFLCFAFASCFSARAYSAAILAQPPIYGRVVSFNQKYILVQTGANKGVNIPRKLVGGGFDVRPGKIINVDPTPDSMRNPSAKRR